MHEHGVNRLSFGVQAAHDTELKRIGRIHDFAQAQAAVELARQCGFSNISLDLMYGLPNQTQAQFLDSVTQCLTLNPQHLSCYGLKLEPATPMGRENPVLPDDDTQADTYLAMCRLLRRNGFEHYEISNFAKPGFRSRHNFKYWDLSDYLGLGPGAHSFLNGRRFAFARDIRAYISGEHPAGRGGGLGLPAAGRIPDGASAYLGRCGYARSRKPIPCQYGSLRAGIPHAGKSTVLPLTRVHGGISPNRGFWFPTALSMLWWKPENN